MSVKIPKVIKTEQTEYFCRAVKLQSPARSETPAAAEDLWKLTNTSDDDILLDEEDLHAMYQILVHWKADQHEDD